MDESVHLGIETEEDGEIDLDKLVKELEDYNGSCVPEAKEQHSPPSPLLNSTLSTALKRIDFVLVYRNKEVNEALEAPQNNELLREKFEDNLRNEGLELVHKPSPVGNNIVFVHIYANWDVLTRYAEVMALRMPMKTIKTNLKLLFDQDYFKKDSKPFTTVFSREKEYLFDIPEQDRENFFSQSQRAEIIDYILKRTRFKEFNDVFSIGINKLLADKVYEAAYPLHDVGNDCNHSNCTSMRCYLLLNWASLKRVFYSQPLEKIVNYFGVKIAMYYAWLGFYTIMLIPASLVGILSFAYGYFTVTTDEPTQSVCNGTFDYPLCPSCASVNCHYSTVSESCMHSKAVYMFGNISTVVFAVFISLWATIFLEMWKRYSAGISYKWDLSDYSTIDEYPRPEYLAALSRTKSKRRINPVTRVEEPYVSFMSGRLPYFIISFSFVLLCVALALLIMISVIIYRVSLHIALLTQHRYERSEFLHKYAELIVSTTAAAINLALILLLSLLYKKLAYWLTELELPRTQNEFDNSLTLKMYLFEFVNYYSSFIYIAFFKGFFTRSPPEGSLQAEKQSMLIEPCPMGGCYFDLTIQLAIIFLGKNVILSMLEYGLPFLYSFYNRRQYFGSNRDQEKAGESHKVSQYEEDYLLESWDHTSLFYEYLELVIQFGFVTLFVSAFPLAPLFALLNNVFEIRLDAKKMLRNYKRPVTQRVKGIGIWYTILDAIGKLSVLTNSLIIAFNTDIIPRAMHYWNFSNLKSYFISSLSIYQVDSRLDPPLANGSYCMYDGYREPPWSENAYAYTENHWHVLVMRIVFVIAFQNIVAALNSLLKVIIPDEPASLRLQKRQHIYITNELIIRQELKSARSKPDLHY